MGALLVDDLFIGSHAMTTLARLLAKIAVSARNGEPEGIRKIKETLRKDPSRAAPHIFTVGEDQMVQDSLRDGPMTREDVFPILPKFAHAYGKASDGISSGYVISVVERYPSLQKKFAIKAFQEIDRLEDLLVTNEFLEPSARAKMLKRIAQLNADRAPVWCNWVKDVSATKGSSIFDVMVSSWLRAPIDWKEESFFDATRRTRRFGVESARVFFEELDFEHHYYFGLKLEVATFQSTGEELNVVFLKDSIEDANKRAIALGVKFRFAKDK